MVLDDGAMVGMSWYLWGGGGLGGEGRASGEAEFSSTCSGSRSTLSRCLMRAERTFTLILFIM